LPEHRGEAIPRFLGAHWRNDTGDTTHGLGHPPATPWPWV
jgi:hypothetical protein